MWNLIVRPEAENDLSEAYSWYEQQRPGLGDDFLLRVEAAFDSIRYDSHTYACIFQNIRRKLIRHFPYGIFYIIAENKVIVLAVMHAKRNPSRWQNRK
jgi:plasmid stabilization system protein ParE